MVNLWKCAAFLLMTSLASFVLAGTSVTASQEPSAVLLTVEVQQEDGTVSQKVQMTLEDLNKFPVTKFNTNTNWTSGEQSFSGVQLYALLQTFGVESGDLELQAINDYLVHIPVSEVTPDSPLVSFARNGEFMTAREKGPLWLVYNYDSDPAFRTETIFSRSIWQLDRITIKR